jgi:hypothetical protein
MRGWLAGVTTRLKSHDIGFGNAAFPFLILILYFLLEADPQARELE